MISAKRLEQLRDRFDIDNDFDRRDKYIAINELIAARTRIAELEQTLQRKDELMMELHDKIAEERVDARKKLGEAEQDLVELRAQGLSQEDSEPIHHKCLRCGAGAEWLK